MLELSSKTNLLEENDYRYSLQDVKEPVLYRDVYDYDEVPKVAFNHRRVPMSMPEDIWITDTSFRDGQQSINPYTPDQIVDLFKLLSKLGGPYGIIRQTEFFIYSQRDREAIARCMDLGLKFPEITTWIRASREDFKAVKDLGIRETGILVSCSDYHIFKKLKMTRSQAMEHYLATVKDAFDAGVMPRCHLEDITRADFYGFVVPFVNELMRLSEEARIPVRIRACDTMGYGVPYTEVALPRSVPGIIYGLQHYSGVASENLEWHGHNDFYKAGLALRGQRRQLHSAGHRRAHRQRASRGHGDGVCLPARRAGRHGPDGDHRDRGLLPQCDRLSHPADDALCRAELQRDPRRHPRRRPAEGRGDLQHLQHRKAAAPPRIRGDQQELGPRGHCLLDQPELRPEGRGRAQQAQPAGGSPQGVGGPAV